jgi:hypothetical protein
MFLAAWGPAMLAWLGLGYQYQKKQENRIEDLASQIRDYNARNNYDRSVSRDTLARDFYNPFETEKLREFTNNNSISVNKYESEIYEELGNPQQLYWTIKFHIFGILLTFSGITYWLPWGFVPTQVYLFILYLLLGISVLLYFYS